MDSTDDRPVFIYALVDPLDGLIHYVGKAYNPEFRYQGHLSEARTPKGGNRRKNRWINDLLAAGLRPGLRILAKATTDTWAEIERAWIERLWDERAPILNVRLGGEQSPPHDERWRAGIARRVKTPEQLEQLRERNRSLRDRTHCKNGHPFDEENTGWATMKDGSIYRFCRPCRTETGRRYYENRKAGLTPKPVPLATHCPKGHSYDTDNTRITALGTRVCRTCKRESSRRRYERLKEVRANSAT